MPADLWPAMLKQPEENTASLGGKPGGSLVGLTWCHCYFVLLTEHRRIAFSAGL